MWPSLGFSGLRCPLPWLRRCSFASPSLHFVVIGFRGCHPPTLCPWSSWCTTLGHPQRIVPTWLWFISCSFGAMNSIITLHRLSMGDVSLNSRVVQGRHIVQHVWITSVGSPWTAWRTLMRRGGLVEGHAYCESICPSFDWVLWSRPRRTERSSNDTSQRPPKLNNG